MESDFYTREGVLDMQMRLGEVIKGLTREKGVRLDPGGVVFFDGSMSLPERGTPWKVTLCCHGRSETVLLLAEDLTEFKAGRLSMVPTRIGMALNRLSGA